MDASCSGFSLAVCTMMLAFANGWSRPSSPRECSGTYAVGKIASRMLR
jgi:hypothetical protein